MPVHRGEPSIDANLLDQLRIARTDREEEPGGGGPRRAWIVGAVVVLLAVAGGAAWWWFEARAVSVQTAEAVLPAGAGAGAAAPTVLQATGYITARRQATVSTQITGTLTEVLIEEGDHVRQGQVLARIEDAALRAGLASAQAQVASADAAIAQAQAQQKQSGADARRQDTLVASGMISLQAAEQSHTALDTSAAILEARRREADAARAQLKQAQVNFDYATVRAPFDGVVTQKAAQVGEIVSPLSAGGGFTRTGVGTIVDMDSLEVDVDVSEAYIGQVKPAMPCEAVLDAYPDWRIPAHVIAIVPSADRGKATVKVRVALEQKDGRIVPDMGTRVAFLGQRVAPGTAAIAGVLVPPEAVVPRDGHVVVFVVREGRVQMRIVAPATPDVDRMKRLPAGVSVGERVVLAPPPTLQDGAAVASVAATTNNGN